MSFIMELPDNEGNRILAEALKIIAGATFPMYNGTPQLPVVDSAVKNAILQMQSEAKENKLKLNRYDYVWLMIYFNEKHDEKKFPLFFYSVQSFRDYLVKELQISGIGSVSLMSQYSNYQFGHFPEWTFSDTEDSRERLRRVNIVNRFLSVFVKNIGKVRG
ncbi:MAG: hypothetical protein J6M36_10510 [Prevotella sp.]|nr:hypothetical protein [Prevotella sp.]